MCGSATLAMEVSSTSMKAASATVAAISQGLTRGFQSAWSISLGALGLRTVFAVPFAAARAGSAPAAPGKVESEADKNLPPEIVRSQLLPGGPCAQPFVFSGTQPRVVNRCRAPDGVTQPFRVITIDSEGWPEGAR